MTAPDAAGTGDAVRVRYASATDVGRVRALNEDSVLTAPPLFAVADGMGGHEAGEVASAIAVEEIGRHAGVEHVRIEDLAAALEAARARIDALGGNGPLSAGTTVALVATMEIDGAGYWVVLNLGDSRVYRASDELFEQVSVDHSVVQELVDAGELTPQQAREHPYRHMITRALGAGPMSEPDYWLIPAEAGDRMLVCSDGLTNEVADPELERILRTASSPQEACDALVARALESGGRDNVSVVVVDALEVWGAPHMPEASGSTSASGSRRAGIEDTLPRGQRRQNGAGR